VVATVENEVWKPGNHGERVVQGVSALTCWRSNNAERHGEREKKRGLWQRGPVGRVALVE